MLDLTAGTCSMLENVASIQDQLITLGFSQVKPSSVNKCLLDFDWLVLENSIHSTYRLKELFSL